MIWGSRRYYDIYALVHADGTWGFLRNLAASLLKEFSFELFRLYRRIRLARPAFPVRSCFGGMALYNASARAVKAVHPSLLVGGPATAVLD